MKTVEVVLCSSCKGRGYLLVENCVDYHRGIYDNDKKDCRKCDNTGRLLKITTVEFEKLKD